MNKIQFFKGCTVVITGASSGFGVEFALQLAPVVETLILTARRLERLERLQAQLQGEFPNLKVLIYPLDLTHESGRVNFVQWVQNQDLPVDFLINNAGLGDFGAFETSDWQKIQQLLQVNMTALTHLTHLFLPLLHEAGRAAILNVSSAAGFFPLPGKSVYAATKAYVTHFSEALRLELQDTGISVTTLCPGPVATEFVEKAQRPKVDSGIPIAPRLKNPSVLRRVLQGILPGVARVVGVTDRVAGVPAMPQGVVQGALKSRSPFRNLFSLKRALFEIPIEECISEGLSAVARDRAQKIPGLAIALAVTLGSLLPFWILKFVLQKRGR